LNISGTFPVNEFTNIDQLFQLYCTANF